MKLPSRPVGELRSWSSVWVKLAGKSHLVYQLDCAHWIVRTGRSRWIMDIQTVLVDNLKHSIRDRSHSRSSLRYTILSSLTRLISSASNPIVKVAKGPKMPVFFHHQHPAGRLSRRLSRIRFRKSWRMKRMMNIVWFL
jgi:hypothetical protein